MMCRQVHAAQAPRHQHRCHLGGTCHALQNALVIDLVIPGKAPGALVDGRSGHCRNLAGRGQLDGPHHGFHRCPSRLGRDLRPMAPAHASRRGPAGHPMSLPHPPPWLLSPRPVGAIRLNPAPPQEWTALPPPEDGTHPVPPPRPQPWPQPQGPRRQGLPSSRRSRGVGRSRCPPFSQLVTVARPVYHSRQSNQ